MADALYTCRALHMNNTIGLKESNRRMVKNKLKQESNIHSIHYGMKYYAFIFLHYHIMKYMSDHMLLFPSIAI